MEGFTQEEIRIMKKVGKMTGVSIEYLSKCLSDFKEFDYNPKVGELYRYVKLKMDDTPMFKNIDGDRVPFSKRDYVNYCIIK